MGGGGQGQSGQAIKLYQITPYVNDFQTLIKIKTMKQLLTAKPKHWLGRSLFLLQNRFLALVLPNLNQFG